MINQNDTVASGATMPVAEAPSPIPAVSKRKASLAVKARSRAVKVNLASRGRLPATVPQAHLKEDVLLADLTMAARDAFNAGESLMAAVKACCDADLDREEVIEAIIAGGWSDSRAKTLVSVVYCEAGKRERDHGAGRPVPKAAISFADYMIEKTESREMAIKMARAALRYLVALEKKAKAVKSAPVVAKSEAK